MDLVHISDALRDVPLERYSPEARKSIAEFQAMIDKVWATAYKQGWTDRKEVGE